LKRYPFLFPTGFTATILVGVALHFLLLHAAFAVPDEVEEAFKKQYPNATEVEWEVDSNGYWEASFEDDGTDYRADFTTDAVWVETETSIEFEDLPDAVKVAVRELYKDDEISEIEKVDSSMRGQFFDVEFKRPGKNQDVEFLADGSRVKNVVSSLESAAGALFEPIPELSQDMSRQASEIGRLELFLEFAFNLITILLYAYVIYYRRHHDHKMLFLLLGFNLFLFPIFLLNTVLTAGFGFTIFALLALVRMRSDTFNKSEVAYLLGAVALTFVNSTLPARVEYVASALVLATAYFGDHPRIWRDAYQSVQIRYPLKEPDKALDLDFLTKQIELEYRVEVNDIEIERVEKKQVRLLVMYRDLPEIRKSKNKKAKKWKKQNA